MFETALRPRKPDHILPIITLHANHEGLRQQIEAVCPRDTLNHYVATAPVDGSKVAPTIDVLNFFTLSSPIQTKRRHVANLGGAITLNNVLRYGNGPSDYCMLTTMQLQHDASDLSRVIGKQNIPIPCALDSGHILLDAIATQKAVARFVFDVAHDRQTPDAFEILDGLLYYQLAERRL